MNKWKIVSVGITLVLSFFISPLYMIIPGLIVGLKVKEGPRRFALYLGILAGGISLSLILLNPEWVLTLVVEDVVRIVGSDRITAMTVKITTAVTQVLGPLLFCWLGTVIGEKIRKRREGKSIK